jgi:hypothetical protein
LKVLNNFKIQEIDVRKKNAIEIGTETETCQNTTSEKLKVFRI